MLGAADAEFTCKSENSMMQWFVIDIQIKALLCAQRGPDNSEKSVWKSTIKFNLLALYKFSVLSNSTVNCDHRWLQNDL